MKKLVSAMLFVTAALTAASAQATALEQPKNVFTFGVYDLSNVQVNGEVVPVEGTTISHQNKGYNICWSVASDKFGKKAKVVEKFTSPAKAEFNTDGKVKSNKEGTQHTVTSKIATLTDESSEKTKYVQNCWEFSEADPVGNYLLTVTVNGVAYPTQRFTVTK